jgi:hypothetical protein
MSYYTAEIGSKLIDPNVFVPNVRCEFQLPPNDYGNRMRLENVGLFGANNRKYNEYAGVFGSIKSIRLLNGRDELDACRECNRYLSFKKRFNRPNKNSLSITQQSMKNEYALVLSGQGVGNGVATPRSIEVTSCFLGAPATLQVAATEAATPKGYLDLREVFPILGALEVLPKALFPQLRIVIEYETNIQNLVDNTADSMTTTRPLLAVDVIEDEGLVKSMMGELNGASWDCVEHDLVRIDANNADALGVESSRRLNGFNNKRMTRFFLSKAPSDKTQNVNGTGVLTGGDLISQALLNEKYQVRVNGMNKIPRTGTEYPAEMMSMLVDAYGDCTTYYGCEKVGAAQQGNMCSAELQGGRNAYFGMYINQVVKDFQLEITRDTRASTKTTNPKPENSGYEIHVFADIRKQLLVAGGKYQVIYA